jgi:hypothetical protein
VRRTPHDGSGRIHWMVVELAAELLKLKKIGQFPDELVKIEDVQIRSVNSQTY